MRKPTLLILSLLSLFHVNAQQRISVAGGLHQSSVTPFWAVQQGAVSQLMQKKSGIHLGLLADMPIGNSQTLYFQPGIYYSSKGAKQQQTFDSESTKFTYYNSSQNIDYIDVPINLVFKFPSQTNTRLIMGGGPFASMFYSGNTSVSSLDTLGNLVIDVNRDLPVGKSDQQFRVLHWGINLLAGIEFGNAYITANYNKGLTPYFQQGTSRYKFVNIGITLGFFLSAPKEDDRRANDGIYYCPVWW